MPFVVNGGGIVSPPDNVISGSADIEEEYIVEDFIEEIIVIEPEIIEPEIIIVDGKEYDISHLTGIEKATITFLATQYKNVMSQEYRDATPFDVHVYRVSNIKLFSVIFEAPSGEDGVPWVEPTLDIDPQSPGFKLRLWWSEQMIKLKGFKERTEFFTPFIIILGVIVVGLVGYQYSKAYVGAKAVKRASK